MGLCHENVFQNWAQLNNVDNVFGVFLSSIKAIVCVTFKATSLTAT